jgi:hypothetical protein
MYVAVVADAAHLAFSADTIRAAPGQNNGRADILI